MNSPNILDLNANVNYQIKNRNQSITLITLKPLAKWDRKHSKTSANLCQPVTNK